MVTIEQLTSQVTILTQQLATQEAKLATMQRTRFNLTADQIIRNFNEIPAFSGEDAYKLRSFLKTVDADCCGSTLR